MTAATPPPPSGRPAAPDPPVSLRDRAVAAGYLAGWALLRWIPERVGRRAFTWVADRAWRGRGDGVRRLEDNLRRVEGPDVTETELRALSRAAMRSYLRYFYETFRLPAMSPEQVLARTHVTGVEPLERTIAAGRGVVAALPHMGNWDQAGAWITRRGIPLTTVAERLRPEAVFRRFLAVRERLGMEVLPLADNQAGVVAALARRLRSGKLVCLLADRDLTDSGVTVELFGTSARLPAGPAALALSTGAALMPVGLWYEGDTLRIRIHPEVPPPADGDRAARIAVMTQEVARVFEAEIAEHPSDWHMLQRVFTTDTAPDPTAGRG